MFSKLNQAVSNARITINYGLRLNKPLLMLRVLKGYLKAINTEIPPLKYVDFAFDYKCNLKCKHCFAVSLTKKNQKQMDANDYLKIAKMCEEEGVLHISFQGGEPLIIPSFAETVNAFDKRKFYLAITTNGFFLTPKKVTWLKEIGIDKITVSLDSMVAKEHDAFRGVPGTFNHALAGINEAIRQGMKVTLNTTLTHQNLHSDGIQKIFEFGFTHHIIVNPIFAAPVGRWLNSTQFMLTQEDVNYVTRLQRENPYLRRDLDSNYYGRGCPAAKEVIYVDAYGNVLPCPFLHVYLGNLTQKHLSDILDDAQKYPPFGHYSPICLAAEDRSFLNLLQKTYKRVKRVPFTLQDLNR
jgi:MoaA/NifB/PqqE/SkfB family radical SAM enzyme